MLNRADSAARQRFTLLHEYKHIIDHGQADRLYRTKRQAEQAADYFAGCALVPKVELKHVFCSGLQRPHDLADHFGVSPTAIQVRLEQTGLLDRPATFAGRCARPISTPWGARQRFRLAPDSFPLPTTSRRSYA